MNATTLRALKGAPTSIILALLVTGRSMTNKELRTWTGYSDKPITDALALLDTEGITQYNGRTYGWSLSAGQMQLPGIHKLSTGTAKLSTELSTEDRRISDLGRVDRRISDLSRTTTTTTDLEVNRSKVVVVQEGQNTEKLRSLLLSAGIRAKSRGMRELLSARVEVERAAAWVTYWRWWKRERELKPGQPVDGRTYFTAGLLIRVLLDGDEIPGRCEECLELPADCFCGVVSR